MNDKLLIYIPAMISIISLCFNIYQYHQKKNLLKPHMVFNRVQYNRTFKSTFVFMTASNHSDRSVSITNLSLNGMPCFIKKHKVHETLGKPESTVYTSIFPIVIKPWDSKNILAEIIDKDGNNVKILTDFASYEINLATAECLTPEQVTKAW